VAPPEYPGNTVLLVEPGTSENFMEFHSVSGFRKALHHLTGTSPRALGSTEQEAAIMFEPTFVNLADAYLCADCEAVGNSANRCPRCQSDALLAITRAIPRHRDSIRILCQPREEHIFRAA
jgi:hypothetical protein